MERSFGTLKPFCCAVVNKPSEASIKALSLCIQQDIPADHLNQLQDYVLFPLRLALKQPKRQLSDSQLCAIASCAGGIFAKSQTERWATFLDVWTQLIGLLAKAKDSGGLAETSEDVKSAIIGCLQSLLNSLSPSNRPHLYSDDFLPVLGHTVHVLLQLVALKSAVSLRVACLKLLQTLASAGNALRNAGADAFAIFLPGISVCLAQLATSNAILHHSVVKQSLRVWHTVVALVINDDQCSRLGQETAGPPEMKRGLSESSELGLKVKRDKAWLKETAEKIHILIKSILSSLLNHDHLEVRLELVNLATNLLQNCFQSLPQSLPSLLDCLVSLLYDLDDSVRNGAKESLAAITGQKSDTVWPSLEANLHNLCLRLPRVARAHPTPSQLTLLLNQLLGYISLMDAKRLTSILVGHFYFKKLWITLCGLLTVDLARVSLVCEVEEQTNLSPLKNLGRQPLHFKFLPLNSHVVQIRDLVKLIVTKTDRLDLLGTSVLDLGHGLVHFEVESLFLINQISICLKDLPNSKAKAKMLEQILDDYMDRISELISEQAPADFRVAEIDEGANLATIKTRLLLEGIGLCSLSLKADFSDHLLKSLWCVLLACSSVQLEIRSAALQTLRNFAAALGHATLSDLIESYADYLIYSVTLKLKRLSIYPRTPLVLATMLKYGSSRLINLSMPLMEDLLRSLDSNYLDRCVLFWRVFQVLVSKLMEWRSVLKQDTPEDSASVPPIEPSGSEEDVENPDFDESTKPPLPPFALLVVKILKRTRHFTASSHRHLQLIVLEVLAGGLQLLKPYANELLPMIHQNWPSLRARFTKANFDAEICRKAFGVVCVMADLSGNFVYRRVKEQLLPDVCEFLREQAKRSLNQKPIYYQSASYKLQIEYLRNLFGLCRDIKIMDCDYEIVVESYFFYLNKYQPRTLQELAVTGLQELCKMSGNLTEKLLRSHKVRCGDTLSLYERNFLLLDI